MLTPSLALELLGLLLLGILVISFSPHLPSLVNPSDSFLNSNMAISIRNTGIFVGIALLLGSALLLFKQYLDVENYFRYAAQLIHEEYLSAPHPWLLAGASRVSRELIVLYGPRGALERLPAALEKLIKRYGPPKSSTPAGSLAQGAPLSGRVSKRSGRVSKRSG